jgi:HAD superfamily hydrolase (TIGR01509 family)
MYKAILFDFFDVIAPDFYRLWLEKNSYERTGDFLAVARDVDSGKISLAEYYNRLSKLSGQSEDSLQDEFENNTIIDKGVVSLIASLHVRYEVGLLTNSPANLVRIILQKNNLERHFDEIIISGEVGCTKPDRKIFELALEKLELPASATVFVDDLELYVRGAQSVGIAGIKFENPIQLRAELDAIGVI